MKKSCTVATSGGTSKDLIGRPETPEIVLMTQFYLYHQLRPAEANAHVAVHCSPNYRGRHPLAQ